MVNYGKALGLPFTNWKRAGLLFLVAALAGLSELLDKETQGLYGILFLDSAFAWVLIFAVSVFFSLLLSGYLIRIARDAAMGKNELPHFGRLFSLLGQGLKYFAAMIVYALPILLLIVLAALFGFQTGMGSILLLLLIPLVILWIFFAVYISPILTVHYAHENRFGAFFELGRIMKYAFTTAYFLPWLVSLAYSVALFVLIFVIAGVVAFVIFGLFSPANIIISVLAGGIYTIIITPSVTSLYGQAYRDITTGKKAHKPAKK